MTSHEGEGSDTLTVTPGTGITTITVTVRDLDGVLISNDVLSASGDYLEFSTPQVPGGCVVTLRDDNGVVFVDQNHGDRFLILFGRICNPPAVSISICNAIRANTKRLWQQ